MGTGADAPGQAKKGNNAEVEQLRQQMQKLQNELQQREQKIQQLQTEVQQLKGKTGNESSKIQQMQQQWQQQLLGWDHKLASLLNDLQAVKNTRCVHASILRPKAEGSESQLRDLLDSAPRTLGKLDGVRGVWVGRSRDAGADSADKSNQAAFVVLLDDAAALRGYLNDGTQKSFHKELSKYAETPTLYDIQASNKSTPATVTAPAAGVTANSKNTTAEIKQVSQELDRLSQALKERDVLKQTRSVHTLILRLKKGAKQDQVKALVDSAPQTLAKIAGVRGVWIGPPAKGSGDDAEKDYQLGLIVLLDDADALRRFESDSTQKQFSDNLKKSWESAATYNIGP
jgi:uncharacterized coiled-coil DUF342 family protein